MRRAPDWYRSCVDFDEAAGELYGVAPGDFVARRKELAGAARTSGDASLAKRITELRRPTMSAWAVNMLARQAAQEVSALLETGQGLRRAWSAGEPLAAWERRRSQEVSAAVRTATELAARAGKPLGPSAQREVEETLEAAVVDPEAGEAVGAGRLVRPLSYAGFAVPAGPFPQAAAAPAKPRRKAEDPRLALRRVEAEAAEAEAALSASRESLTEWRDHLEAARGELTAAEAHEEGLKRELEAARQRRQTAEKRVRTGEREHTQAQRSAEAAERLAAEARQRLEAARSRADPT